MRSVPPWVWLLLAVVFGTAASILALGWLKHPDRQPAQAPAVIKVVVAKTEIGAATRITPAMIQLESWPQKTSPKGSFASVSEVEGRVTAGSLSEGELITDRKLVPKGATPGLPALLPVNKRAMTVKVDEASGVAGFLAPENRVDVVVTVDRGDFSKNPLSKVIFQNLKVLGTGQKIETRPGDKPQVVPTVTLEVTPEEGERLALAAQEGRISLVLRGQQDDQVVETRGVTTQQLFQNQTEARPVPAAKTAAPCPPPRRTVEIIRRLQRQPTAY